MRKMEISPFATTWMDLKGIMLTEISQTEKDKYCMMSYVESKNVRCVKTEQNGRYQQLGGGGTGEVWFKGTDMQRVEK